MAAIPGGEPYEEWVKRDGNAPGLDFFHLYHAHSGESLWNGRAVMAVPPRAWPRALSASHGKPTAEPLERTALRLLKRAGRPNVTRVSASRSRPRTATPEEVFGGGNVLPPPLWKEETCYCDSGSPEPEDILAMRNPDGGGVSWWDGERLRVFKNVDPLKVVGFIYSHWLRSAPCLIHSPRMARRSRATATRPTRIGAMWRMTASHTTTRLARPPPATWLTRGSTIQCSTVRGWWRLYPPPRLPEVA